MRRKRPSALALTGLTLLLAATACSNGGGGNGNGGDSGNAAGANEGGETKAADPITLGLMWWGTDERHEATKNALALYTKQNAGVTFKPEFMAWDAYWQKLPTLAASKTIPDVLQMDAAYIQEYVARGQLEDLSDIDLSGIVDPNVVENLKIDGKLYGIPLSQNAQGIAYNKVGAGSSTALRFRRRTGRTMSTSNGRGMPARNCRRTNIRSATRRTGAASTCIRRPWAKTRSWPTAARNSRSTRTCS